MINLLSICFVLLLSCAIQAQEPGQLNLKSILDTLKTAPSTANQTEEKQKPKKDPISEIIITGNKQIPTKFIQNEMSLEVGDPLNPYRINRDVRNIQSTGIFASVRSEIKKEPGKITLIIHIKENPILKSIKFEGVTLYDKKELAKIMVSKEGEVFNLSNVRKDIQAIESKYHDDGYFQAKVFNVQSPEALDDPLIINVGEGVLETIIVTGNTKTQDYVILRELDLKPGDILERDQLSQNLRRVYNLNYFTSLNPMFLPGEKPNAYQLKLDITERETNGSFTFGGGYSPTSGFSIFSDL